MRAIKIVYISDQIRCLGQAVQSDGSLDDEEHEEDLVFGPSDDDGPEEEESSCEIETAAMVRMLKEERFAVQVGEFMGIEFDGPTACITDNKATYDIVRNPGATKRTAHFDRWLHFARELYLKNAIKIYLTTTDKMMADIMTKPTDKTTFLRCCAYILTDGHVD